MTTKCLQKQINKLSLSPTSLSGISVGSTKSLSRKSRLRRKYKQWNHLCGVLTRKKFSLNLRQLTTTHFNDVVRLVYICSTAFVLSCLYSLNPLVNCVFDEVLIDETRPV